MVCFNCVLSALYVAIVKEDLPGQIDEFTRDYFHGGEVFIDSELAFYKGAVTFLCFAWCYQVAWQLEKGACWYLEPYIG